ncbi:hypothetical protein C8R48DRAFT_255574 [Suillus tomentosus]|nr:hypothetical protein C8R48DRAFT_255574 [Suillus tomentosus]
MIQLLYQGYGDLFAYEDHSSRFIDMVHRCICAFACRIAIFPPIFIQGRVSLFLYMRTTPTIRRVWSLGAFARAALPSSTRLPKSYFRNPCHWPDHCIPHKLAQPRSYIVDIRTACDHQGQVALSLYTRTIRLDISGAVYRYIVRSRAASPYSRIQMHFKQGQVALSLYTRIVHLDTSGAVYRCICAFACARAASSSLTRKPQST